MANTLRFKRGLVSTIPTALAGEPLFTTDTFDLYIGNGTGNTRFQKYIASGTTSQLLRGDGSLLTMPIVLTSPANGQVLKYNGTSWVNDSDAGITGSLTTNYIPRATNASTLGNSVLFQGTRALGIQTATPVDFGAGTYNFHLHDDGIPLIQFTNSTTGQSSSVGSRIQSNGNDLLFINSQSTGVFRWNTNGAERMRLHAGGNLHLGGTSDNGLRFQVTGDGYFSGRLNVGNTNTTYNLDVTGTGRFSNFLLVNSAGSVTSGFSNGINLGTWDALGYETNDLVLGGYRASQWQRIRFYTLGTERMRLDASGNLGLGVTPSAWDSVYRVFQIGGNPALASQEAVQMVANGYYNAGWKYIANNYAARYEINKNNGGIHAWYNAPSGTAGNAITFTQAMTLDASGNLLVGITTAGGSTTPVNISLGSAFGTNTAGSTANLKLRLYDDGVNTNHYGFGVSSNLMEVSFPSSLAFFNGASASRTERMRINASGRVLIGSSSDSGETFQLTGTMRVSGASTFGGLMTVNAKIQSGTRAFIEQNGSGDADMGAAAGGVLTLYSQGISRLLFNSSGQAVFNTAVSNGVIIQSGGINVTGAATFSSTAQAAGFITSGGTGYAVINSASNTVTALRPTGGGVSIMSTNSNGLHIAVGTQAAGDLILASNNTERIRLSSNGFFSQLNATNPSASITDSYIQYSADVVAGNAAPHFRTENGAVIKLYQETTAVGNSIISLGGGNSVLDDTTFDGYTLRQIVKALRNQGILQ